MRARFPYKGFKAPLESEHDEESWGELLENGCSEERVSKQLDATTSPPPSSFKLQEKQPACPGAQETMETIGNGGVNNNDQSCGDLHPNNCNCHQEQQLFLSGEDGPEHMLEQASFTKIIKADFRFFLPHSFIAMIFTHVKTLEQWASLNWI
jgi:hypothetical protein